MWRFENDAFFDTEFPCPHWTTTKPLGNMRDPAVRQRFCLSRDIDADDLVTAEQVHSAQVTVVDGSMKGRKMPRTDGLVTAVPRLPLAILTADCVPVFLAAAGAVGVIHAGWRGLAGKILPAAVAVFGESFGIKPDGISAAIGPHIGKCCYEIGQELRDAFGLPADASHLDLSTVALSQLEELGVRRISVSGRCTYHEGDTFFSYRRDKTDERIMSVICLK